MTTPLAVALSPLELLREHVGHRCTIQEPTPGKSLTVKCVDCTRSVDLSAVFGLRPGTAPATTTGAPAEPAKPAKLAKRGLPRLDDPDACPDHPGHWHDTCGPCRSERIANPDPVPHRPTGAPPNDAWRQAREALTQRSSHQQEPHP
jgi:hypothetical protein